MEQAIVNYLSKNPLSTFAQLCRDIPNFAGDLALHCLDFDNLFLWLSISKEAIDALAKLDRESKLIYKETAGEEYFVDGKTLSLPVTHVLKHYATPHWRPLLISLG